MTRALPSGIPQVVAYRREDGRSPFGEWLSGLNDRALRKVQVAVLRMADGNFGDHKSVGDGVMERRIHFGPGVRVYYAKEGDTLVLLLTGGTKKRQSRDVAEAKTLWADYRRRRDAGEETLLAGDEDEDDGEPDADRPDEPRPPEED